MTLVFAIVLVVHGLIHAIGFAKAFGLADLPELTQPISPLLGALWLLTALLFFVAAAALFLWPRGGGTEQSDCRRGGKSAQSLGHPTPNCVTLIWGPLNESSPPCCNRQPLKRGCCWACRRSRLRSCAGRSTSANVNPGSARWPADRSRTREFLAGSFYGRMFAAGVPVERVAAVGGRHVKNVSFALDFIALGRQFGIEIDPREVAS
jgi:hypothetical protein